MCLIHKYINDNIAMMFRVLILLTTPTPNKNNFQFHIKIRKIIFGSIFSHQPSIVKRIKKWFFNFVLIWKRYYFGLFGYKFNLIRLFGWSYNIWVEQEFEKWESFDWQHCSVSWDFPAGSVQCMLEVFSE